jgi:ATP-dependent Clp protease ATP-binding subunit ClpX
LTEPKNAIIKQYQKMFEIDGKSLVVEPEVLDFVVSTAIDKKVGARGLRSICEKIFTEAMYEAPSSEEKVYTVTLDFAKSVL